MALRTLYGLIAIAMLNWYAIQQLLPGATLLAVLCTTCESGMLEEIRQVSEITQAARETRYRLR